MITLYTPTPPIHWSWVTLAGADAKEFLHRITTVSTQSMKSGQGANGCLLSGYGKIRASFTLWNYAEGEYGFEFNAGQDKKWKKELFTAIDQYTFAEKITLADVTVLECRWIFAEDDALPFEIEPGQTIAIDDEIRLCHHGKLDYGRPWITAWARPARLEQWIEQTFPDTGSTSFEQLESWRIAAIRPRIDAEITETTVPLEAGMLDSLAQQKGCYPGQEVIERILSLGSPARRLALIEGEGRLPRPGDAIFNLAAPPGEVGKITSVAAIDDHSFKALGYLRKIHAKEGLEIQFIEDRMPTAKGRVQRITPYE